MKKFFNDLLPIIIAIAIAYILALCTSCSTTTKLENQQLRDVTNSLQTDVLNTRKENTVLHNQIDSLSKIIMMKDSTYHEVYENKETERINDTVYVTKYVRDYWYNYSSKSNSLSQIKDNSYVSVSDSTSEKEHSKEVIRYRYKDKTVTVEKEVVPKWAWIMAGLGLLSLIFSTSYFYIQHRKHFIV